MSIERDESFFDKAQRRFKAAVDAWKPIYDEMDIDLKFATGDQWDEAVKTNRETQQGRPTLTFDVLHTNIQVVANKIRQDKPAIKISPAGGGAKQETAKVYAGIIRHWNYLSQGDIARDTASKYQLSGGIGFYRVATKYVNPDPSPDDADAFDQDGTTEWIRDPKSVYFDPDVEQPQFQDAGYCFIIKWMSWEKYKDKYGDRSDASWETWDQSAPLLRPWANEKEIAVAEYWHKEETESKITVKDKERVKTTTVVKQDFMNGIEVLSSTEWLTDDIPIIPVLGEETIVEGKLKIASLIRYVRDAAKLRNGYKSAIAENIGLTNRVPYTGPRGMFKGPGWRDAHLTNPAYLEWDPVYDTNGHLILAKPERNPIEPAVQALTESAAVESDDIKSGMGIFDSSIGAAKAEYSGVSVERRTQQADITNFHFSDNLTRAMWVEGNILLKLIPKLIDTPRAMKIMDEDGTISEVAITMALNDGEPPMVDGIDPKDHHRVDVGRYSCTVSTGPTWDTQRKEEYETWMEFLAKAPELAPAFLPVVLKWSDTPGADKLAEIAGALAPPAVQAILKGEQAPDPQAQAQLAAASQQIQEMQAKIMQLEFDKKAETQKLQAQHLTDVENNAVKIAIAEIQSKNKQDIAAVLAELDAVKTKLEMWQGHAEIAQQHEHDMAKGQQQIDASQQAQASDQVHSTMQQQAAAEQQQSEGAGQ
jgi:hypothetical protein